MLPWLTWKDRLPLFQLLRDIAGKRNLTLLVYAMNQVPDRRVVDVYWQLLADEKLPPDSLSSLEHGLIMSYLGVNNIYSLDRTTKKSATPRQREMFRAAKHWAASGRQSQRLVALAILTYTADEGASQLAEQLADDAKLDADLRHDAFQVALMMESERDARRRAIAALKDADPKRRKLAMEYLTNGRNYLGMLREELTLQGGGVTIYYSNSATPILPKPPIGLEAAQVRPLLAEADPQAAAEAGYLLALLEQPDGLETLLRFVHGKDDWQWKQLAVRAIAVLDDQSHVAVLREIYSRLEHNDSEVRDFYWTIRLMTGPEILKLRKQIRDRGRHGTFEVRTGGSDAYRLRGRNNGHACREKDFAQKRKGAKGNEKREMDYREQNDGRGLLGPPTLSQKRICLFFFLLSVSLRLCVKSFCRQLLRLRTGPFVPARQLFNLRRTW